MCIRDSLTTLLGINRNHNDWNRPNVGACVHDFIGRLEDGSPSGYLEEAAFTSSSAAVPQPDLETRLKQLSLAEDSYLQYGIATVQDLSLIHISMCIRDRSLAVQKHFVKFFLSIR